MSTTQLFFQITPARQNTENCGTQLGTQLGRNWDATGTQLGRNWDAIVKGDGVHASHACATPNQTDDGRNFASYCRRTTSPTNRNSWPNQLTPTLPLLTPTFNVEEKIRN